jgi:cobalamin synthase
MPHDRRRLTASLVARLVCIMARLGSLTSDVYGAIGEVVKTVVLVVITGLR